MTELAVDPPEGSAPGVVGPCTHKQDWETLMRQGRVGGPAGTWGILQRDQGAGLWTGHTYTVIGLIRWAGYTNIAAACRRFAAQPVLALSLLGIALENSMALLRPQVAAARSLKFPRQDNIPSGLENASGWLQ